MAVQSTQRGSASNRTAFVDRALDLLRPLTNYARSELRAHVALGDIPPGMLKPEDIVDSALTEALRHADDAPERRLFPWLRRFVRRAIRREVAVWRRHRRERSLFDEIGRGKPDEDGRRPRQLIEVLPDPKSPIPDEVAASDEFQELLARQLAQLPRDWRDPFILHVRDGLSFEEIARLEALPVAEVQRRIDRAREVIRRRLGREYRDGDVLASTDTLFQLLERIEPTPEQAEQIRSRLQAAVA